ncbi:hypothetical protein [Nocardioides yefusunii]|uniref:Integrase n=1 Tax=Nocardioides yefusunii TaxID=2500546 RepID=A0ABW1QZL5_9ACTN|nr:hypothetical protein [Nocardioides yefusunii]
MLLSDIVRQTTLSDLPAIPDMASRAPSITSARTVREGVRIAPVSADAWPLEAVSHPDRKHPTLFFGAPSARRASEYHVSDDWLVTYKRIAWALINHPTPLAMYSKQGARYANQPSAGTVNTFMQGIKRFLDWLDSMGVSTLSACTPDLLDLYAQDIAAQDLSTGYKQAFTRVLYRLHHMGPVFEDHERLCMPGWGDATPFRTGPSGENRTQIVHPETMDALLNWSLRMVRECADDILDAWQREPVKTTPVRGAAKRFIRNWLDCHDGTLPANKSGVDQRYLAYLAGCSENQVKTALKDVRAELREDRTFGAPISFVGSAVIDGRPWATQASFYDLVAGRSRGGWPYWVSHLQTAALIVVTYLTGMRPGEALSLRPGCVEEVPPNPERPEGVLTYLVHGTVLKTRDQAHTESLGARDATWVASQPVVDAIRVAERINAGADYLFTTPHAGKLNLGTANAAINDYANWVNDLVRREGHNGAHLIPADPHGSLAPSRFRRSIAWFIYQEDDGEVALGMQFKHLEHSLGRDGYAATGTVGMANMMDEERARAHLDLLDSVTEFATSGTHVSGPAADRLVDQVGQSRVYLATVTSSRAAQALARDSAFAVFDNRRAFSLCVYNPSTALCSPQSPDGPDTLRCKSNCPNHARTDETVAPLVADLERLRQSLRNPLLPEPLRLRQEALAADRLRVVEDHRDNARFVQLEEAHGEEEP